MDIMSALIFVNVLLLMHGTVVYSFNTTYASLGKDGIRLKAIKNRHNVHFD